ncbi:non-ribosomal peptide synthetase [Amycolatopsis azurea]|uniref:Long-chain-fatty-acid--CoA ligase n=1 Tax=Amycolatopsis azurea DSM 43854 TaxID=1238180 RepID=M2NIP0_9PSEU|nr:non-ribosomal peptide synthetase [Amycolatopsis azurea]EMD21964.1 Long-chain-fatty-acid--CoA ligase [Amycolatopsis azurea DSM 43854]OOC00988.1 non-ribosomal peptide synthetase [Amycolatopsis azurea DSM 43854]
MSFNEYASAVLGQDIEAGAFATTSFVGLGGDSLRALKLAAIVQEKLGLRIPVAALLSGTPVADVFAGAVPTGKSVTGAEPPTESVSRAQRGMWLIERVTGGSPYNLVFTCFVETGTLEPELFERAVARTVARHPGLRTVYRGDDGDVVPEVLEQYTPPIEVHTWEGEEGEFDERVRSLAARHGRHPFDLAKAPAYRFLRVQGGTGGQAIVLVAHHMVLDGWSVGLLLNELFDRYATLAGGGPEHAGEPGVSPRVLLRHQEEARATGEWDRQAEFWTKHLDGVPSVLELPSDRQRPPIQDAAGARAPIDFGVPASAAVVERAKALGITPFAFLLGAFGLTLSRWTGTRHLLVGVPLTGRGSTELEELVAVAGNLVPVRIDVAEDAAVATYLRSVHQSLGQSIDAGDLPFEELVTRLGIERALGCHPLVQVSFGMHDQLVPQRIETSAARLRIEEGHGGGAQFDLSLLIGRAEPALGGHLEYASAVFGRADAEGFIADFLAAADQLAAAGDVAVEEIRCLSTERRALLDGINRTRDDFPATSIDALFRETVLRAPDAIAVREHEAQLSYGELAAAASRQARLLREAGVRPGDRVLVGLDRSIAEAVAVLGIVWAGAAYVGVDLTAPAEHSDKIVRSAAPVAALAPEASAERLRELGIPVVAAWDQSWDVREVVEPPVDPDTTRLAYVAFTSGSTGQPKGVCVPHRAIVRLVHEADYVRLGPEERVLRLSPLAFDASTLELWGALLTGATLEVYPAGLPTPTELGEFLLDNEVTVAWLTAGLFRLVEEFAGDAFAGLRQLLTGGDVVPHEHVARVLRRHPGLVITNGYGPTENTTFTTTYSVTDADDVDGPLPIGTPLPGTRVYVLDARHRIVPPGAVGELYTSGLGLADGYLDDEAETARAFGEFSPDVPERLYRTGDLVRVDTKGRIRYLGRRDDQVKLRGYRVELSAISDALTADPRVQDAVVAVSDGDSAEKRLMAAVVPAPGAAFGTADLRDALSGRLPTYMVPTLWALVERIPLTGNGKVDRRALAAVAVAATAAPKPQADLGPALAMFSEAIGDPADEITAETDFFTVGGNSMAAIRLVTLAKERTGAILKVRDFLRDPTPEGLGKLLASAS